jgi:hypothetical protein
MAAREQIETKIHSAIDSVIQQVIDTDDSIARAVVGRNTTPQLAVNSSFLYRDSQALQTRQSHRRLTARLASNGRRVYSDGISILDTGTLRVHYRLIAADDASANVPLPTAVAQEIASIGDLVFLLIGTVKGLRPFVQAVDAATVKEIRLEPSAEADFRKATTGIYVIRKLLPVEDLLSQIHTDLLEQGGLSHKDGQNLAKAYDKMLDNVTTDVTVPRDRVLNPAQTILGQIAASLRRQTDEYRDALTVSRNAPEDRHALYEVLRIAYNFSADVLPLIYLFVSICDLKPLVFWCTVKQHWALYRAFSSLPWSALGRKESLAAYEKVISQARSYAFHHVLPFETTIEIDLSNLDVRAEKIRLFAPYGEREDRGVSIRDQKLADVLAEFSRAKERPVSTAFWQANLKVMEQACDLTKEILTTLLLIHEARRESPVTSPRVAR